MSYVKVDADELKHFQQSHLRRNIDEFENVRDSIDMSISEYINDNHWNDPQSKQFVKEYVHSRGAFEEVIKTMRELDAYLNRKIAILNEYQQTRI